MHRRIPGASRPRSKLTRLVDRCVLAGVAGYSPRSVRADNPASDGSTHRTIGNRDDQEDTSSIARSCDIALTQ